MSLIMNGLLPTLYLHGLGFTFRRYSGSPFLTSTVILLDVATVTGGHPSYITTIGREQKIAVEKGRPSASGLITGVPPVTFCAGSSESDHSGVLPVKVRWSGT